MKGNQQKKTTNFDRVKVDSQKPKDDDQIQTALQFSNFLEQITSECKHLKHYTQNQNLVKIVGDKKMDHKVNQILKFMDERYEKLMNIKLNELYSNFKRIAIPFITINKKMIKRISSGDVSPEEIILEKVSTFFLFAYFLHRLANKNYESEKQHFREKIIFIYYFMEYYQNTYEGQLKVENSFSGEIDYLVREQLRKLSVNQARKNNSNNELSNTYQVKYTLKILINLFQTYYNSSHLTYSDKVQKLHKTAILQIQSMVDNLQNMIKYNLSQVDQLKPSQAEKLRTKMDSLERQKKSILFLMELIKAKQFEWPQKGLSYRQKIIYYKTLSFFPELYKRRHQRLSRQFLSLKASYIIASYLLVYLGIYHFGSDELKSQLNKYLPQYLNLKTNSKQSQNVKSDSTVTLVSQKVYAFPSDKENTETNSFQQKSQ